MAAAEVGPSTRTPGAEAVAALADAAVCSRGSEAQIAPFAKLPFLSTWRAIQTAGARESANNADADAATANLRTVFQESNQSFDEFVD